MDIVLERKSFLRNRFGGFGMGIWGHYHVCAIVLCCSFCLPDVYEAVNDIWVCCENLDEGSWATRSCLSSYIG